MAAFMLLHFALILWAAITAGLESLSDRLGSDGFFWSIFVIGLLVISLAGQNVIRSERRNNTLELLQLTRQDAWQIVFGKWSALMVRIGLFLSSLLPYALLRYFFGTFDFVSNASLLLFILFALGPFCALMVFISCFGRWMSFIVNILLGMSLFIAPVAVLSSRYWRSGSGLGMVMDEGFWVWALAMLVLALFSTVYTWLLLADAADRISSPSDNLITRKRLLGVVSLIPVMVAAAVGAAEQILLSLGFAAAPVLVIVFLDAILAHTSPGLPNFVAFARRGAWGRCLACVLTPSRSSGFAYMLIVTCVLMGTMVLFTRGDADHWLPACGILLAFLNSFIFPYALARPGGRAFKGISFVLRYWIFWGLQAVFPIFILLASITLVSKETAKALVMISPVGALFGHNGASETGLTLIFSGTIFILSLGLLFAYLRRDRLAVRAMMKGERVNIPRA